MLEDLVAAAFNDARAKADAAAAQEMKKMSSGCRCRQDSSCPSRSFRHGDFSGMIAPLLGGVGQ